MSRIAKISLIGSLTALLLGAGAARADEHFAAPPNAPAFAFHGDREGYGRPQPARYDDRGFEHELREARERFYKSWNGDRRTRARFERWCAERRAEHRRHEGRRYDRW